MIESDLFQNLPGRTFDLVVFNPPWLPLPEMLGPRSHLDSGNFYPKDLFLRIFDALPEVLSPGGVALLLFSNHALIRGYVDEHPFQVALKNSKSSLQSQLFSRDFNLEGRRRRTGRPQVNQDDEPCAELWEFRVEKKRLTKMGVNVLRDINYADMQIHACYYIYVMNRKITRVQKG